MDETSHLYRINPYTLKFDTIQFEGLDQGMPVISRTFEKNGKYYSIVQTDHRISIYELRGDTGVKVTDVSTPQGTAISQYSSFIPCQHSFVLIADGLGAALFNWEGKLLYIFEKSNIRRFSLVSFEGKKYFMLKRAPVLYTFSPEKQRLVKAFDFSQQLGLSRFIFWNDAAGHLLLSAFNQSNLSIYRVSQEGLTDKRIIKGVDITKWPYFFSRDASKSVWMANQANRIIQFRFHDSGIKRFLEKERIGAIYQKDADHFLVSTSNAGLFMLDLKDNTVHPFKLWLGNKLFSIGDICRNIIPSKNPGSVWINYRHGIAQIDLVTHRVKVWPNYMVESLERLNDSLLVYGTYRNGLWIFNTRTKKQHIISKDKRIWGKDILVQDHIIYVATQEGLLVYNFISGKGFLYSLPEKEIKNDEPNYIFYSQEEEVIMGTVTGRVYRFNPETKAFSLWYKTPEPVPIATMFFEKNRLWMNTGNGILVWDTMTKKTRRYSTIDGLSDNISSRFSLLRTDKGTLVGTEHGLNYFDPATLKPVSYDGQIVPLSMLCYNTNTGRMDTLNDRQKLAQLHRIVLPVGNRFFRLNFGLAQEGILNRVRYKYRLNDTIWIPVTQGNAVQFNNLAPGHYQLEVAAFDPYEHLVGRPLKYTLIAKDFFYNRWWFSAGIVFVLLIIIGGIIFSRLQHKELKLKREANENLYQSRLNLEEKLAMEHLLFEERKNTLEGKKRELVATSLRLANVKNAVQATLDNSKNGDIDRQIKQKLKLILNRDDEWELFMKKFVDVYPGFLQRIKEKYPLLTDKDLDFCALIKLNLSNKEIATLLNISHQSVITKKYRLRKKIDISGEDTSLEEWMTTR